jgi:hypothetical protein
LLKTRGFFVLCCRICWDQVDQVQNLGARQIDERS